MDVNKKIETLRWQRGWSMYELAQEMGVTQSTLTSIMKRGNPPKIDTLERICEAFGISLAQFFIEDGEEFEVLNEKEKALVSLFRKLPEEKQAALVKLLER